MFVLEIVGKRKVVGKHGRKRREIAERERG